MDAIQFIVWTCAIIFAATGVITLLAIVKIIPIEKRFLNKLFVVLILEIVAVSIGIYTVFLQGDGGKNTSQGIEIQSIVQLVDSKEKVIDSYPDEFYDKYLKIRTVPDYSVRTSSGVILRIYAESKKDLPKIVFSLKDFKPKIIDLNIYSDSIINNKLDLGTIKLKKVNQRNANTGDPLEPMEGGPAKTENNDTQI